MSSGEPRLQFSIEQFAADLEAAANSHEIASAEAMATPALWVATKGRVALTSLLTAGFVFADRIPKVQSDTWTPLRLSQIGEVAVTGLDAIITVSAGVYDVEQYRAIQAPIRTPRSDKEHPDHKKLYKPARQTVNPEALISDTRVSKFYSEYGLGLTKKLVKSELLRGESLTSRRRRLDGLVHKMVINGSVDADIIFGLEEMRKASDHTDEEYVKGLIELARQTSVAIAQKTSAIQNYNSSSAKLRRFVRKRI